jgi:hypothetical protein
MTFVSSMETRCCRLIRFVSISCNLAGRDFLTRAVSA